MRGILNDVAQKDNFGIVKCFENDGGMWSRWRSCSISVNIRWWGIGIFILSHTDKTEASQYITNITDRVDDE